MFQENHSDSIMEDERNWAKNPKKNSEKTVAIALETWVQNEDTKCRDGEIGLLLYLFFLFSFSPCKT